MPRTAHAHRPGSRGPRNRSPQRPDARHTSPGPDATVYSGNATPVLPPAASFADLGLPAALQSALDREGITELFPIQAAALPNSLAGRDVLGRGRTGSGKTLAFGLTLLARTAGQRAEPRHPLALVLVPTRELAQQVTDALAGYARVLHLRLATVVGGTSIGRQSARLRDGADVVVATPGRLKDLIERGDCRLDRVRITVLDEADQMADMGFLPQVTALLRQVPADGQRLLFSATLDRDVDRLVRTFLTDPAVHSVDPPASAVTTMEHYVLRVSDEDKSATAVRIAARDGRALLFVGTKRGADRLTRRLLASGVRAAALHGGRSQAQRNRTLDQFKSGQVTALVATNVAARGIHVDDLDLVVNVDPPTSHKDYLHRGGRTARAGASGTVVTLVLAAQHPELRRLTAAAGIAPHTLPTHPDDAELARITGARTPPGVPVTVAAPVPAGPAAPAAAAESPAAAPSSRRSRRSRRSRGRPGRSQGAPRTGASAGASRHRGAA